MHYQDMISISLRSHGVSIYPPCTSPPNPTLTSPIKPLQEPTSYLHIDGYELSRCDQIKPYPQERLQTNFRNMWNRIIQCCTVLDHGAQEPDTHLTLYVDYGGSHDTVGGILGAYKVFSISRCFSNSRVVDFKCQLLSKCLKRPFINKGIGVQSRQLGDDRTRSRICLCCKVSPSSLLDHFKPCTDHPFLLEARSSFWSKRVIGQVTKQGDPSLDA